MSATDLVKAIQAVEAPHSQRKAHASDNTINLIDSMVDQIVLQMSGWKVDRWEPFSLRGLRSYVTRLVETAFLKHNRIGKYRISGGVYTETGHFISTNDLTDDLCEDTAFRDFCETLMDSILADLSDSGISPPLPALDGPMFDSPSFVQKQKPVYKNPSSWTRKNPSSRKVRLLDGPPRPWEGFYKKRKKPWRTRPIPDLVECAKCKQLKPARDSTVTQCQCAFFSICNSCGGTYDFGDTYDAVMALLSSAPHYKWCSSYRPGSTHRWL